MVIISVLVTTEEKNNMATVRFSEELRDTIQHNARRMFNDKLAITNEDKRIKVSRNSADE